MTPTGIRAEAWRRKILTSNSPKFTFRVNCTEILVFEPWEVEILTRLSDHILPFRTVEGERFLEFYYNFLDREAKDTQYRQVYRFDDSVGAVNFIDKLLAKEENHHLLDYKI